MSDRVSTLKDEPKRKEFESFQSRFDTYEKWPIHFIDPTDLARAGLYYLGEDDRVRCFFCGGGLRHWERNDVPIQEHRKLFPNCGFLAKVFSCNKDISEDSKFKFQGLHF